MNRRGFFKGLIAASATVAIGLRMAHGQIAMKPKYTWDSANADYSYGIDKDHPWDVVILDERKGEFITPYELVNNRSRLHWFGKPAPPPPFKRGELCAPIQPQGAETDMFKLRDHGCENTYDDPIDRAYITVAAIGMSQAMLGIKHGGKPGFDGPWKEIDDDIIEPRIITTSEEYYAELRS